MTSDTLIFDSALRLMRGHLDGAAWQAHARGEFLAALWKPLVGAGFSDILLDGIDESVGDAMQVLRAQGTAAAPVPLLEAMLATVPGWGKDAVHDANNPATLTSLNGNVRGAFATHADADTLWLFGALARAAQMRGALEHILGLTTDYVNTRVQFGKPLARQQAVQHQLALMAEEAAAAGVAVDHAIRTWPQASQRRLAAASAKLRAGEAAGKAAAIAHQMHGAIGYTQEYELQRYTRSLWSWRDQFGNEAEWAQDIGTELTQPGGAPLWPALTQTSTQPLTRSNQPNH